MSIVESMQNFIFGEKAIPTSGQVQSAYEDAGIDYTKLRNIAESQLDPESQYMQDKLARLENVSQDEIATNQMLTERMYDKFGGNANPAVMQKLLADFANTRADKTRVQGQQIIDQSQQAGMSNLSQVMSNQAQIVKQGLEADMASKQEDAQRRRDMFGYLGSGLDMLGFKMQEGGLISQSLKQIPAGNKGLARLPEEVRNRMGYMQYGGMVPRYAYGGMVKKKGYQTGNMVSMTPEEYLATDPPNAIKEMIKSGMNADAKFIGPRPQMTPEEEMWQRAVTGDPNEPLKLPSKEAVKFLSEVKKPEEEVEQAPTVNPNARKRLEEAMASGEISLPGPSLLNRIFEKAGAGAGTIYGGLSGAVANPKVRKGAKGILDFLSTMSTEIARPGTYQTNKLFEDLDLKPVGKMQNGGYINGYSRGGEVGAGEYISKDDPRHPINTMTEADRNNVGRIFGFLKDYQNSEGKNIRKSVGISEGFEGDEGYNPLYHTLYDIQEADGNKSKGMMYTKSKDGKILKHPTMYSGGLLSGVRNFAGQLMGSREVDELPAGLSPEELQGEYSVGFNKGGYVKYPMRIGGYKID